MNSIAWFGDMPIIIPSRPVARTCRRCGCTDADCHECILRTGAPCHWVTPDLCSACVQVDLREWATCIEMMHTVSPAVMLAIAHHFPGWEVDATFSYWQALRRGIEHRSLTRTHTRLRTELEMRLAMLPARGIVSERTRVEKSPLFSEEESDP